MSDETAAPWGVCAACNSGACATADSLGRKATCDCCATHGATAATCPECGGHSDLPHDDIRAIMVALDISDHARPYSTHAVVHREILPAIRRLRGI